MRIRKPKRELVSIPGYMITFYRCPYCGNVFSYDDAVKDRNSCHKKYVSRLRYRRSHPKKKRWFKG